VTHRGRVTVVEAKLYSRPAAAPPLLGAAVTEATAEAVGAWADGLLTTGGDPEQVKKVVAAFRRGGGTGKRVVVQLGLSWAPTEAEALGNAWEQWRYASLGGDVNWELRSPEDFDTASAKVRPEDMREGLVISESVDRHVEAIAGMIEAGADEVYLHNVGPNQEAFLDAFGARVLPQLRPRQPASPAGSTSGAPAA
jgi:alkanesulfonate monooxygenase SsuD/methylene tetrahydromethanopterin reductase-like flavin-dependent oxidoreductase (luciferase family)